MEPDADPEARIRDLERPLVERARAGELGAQPYPPPPGPSPDHTWVLPLVIGVVAMVAAVGAVVYFTAGSPAPSAPASDVAGWGGPIDGPALPELGSESDIVTVGPGQVTSIAGVETRRTVRCDAGTVTVSGVGNTVEVTGPCAAVTVSGMNNVVTLETTRTIAASGFDNRITYRSGAPEVVTSGSGNVVEQS